MRDEARGDLKAANSSVAVCYRARPMRIHVVDFIAGAAACRGVAIVVDVFRACSLIAHALARGAEGVIPVADIEAARALKRAHPEWLLVGERHGRPLPGFDAGNSPSELAAFELAGRTIVHTTHAGTQGLAAAAQRADLVLTGALVNASATAAYVRALAPREVYIVRMGHQAERRCAEDDLCAELLVARLEGRPCAIGDAAARLRTAPAAEKFFDPHADWAPQADFELCTRTDLYGFAAALGGASGLPPAIRKLEAR